MNQLDREWIAVRSGIAAVLLTMAAIVCAASQDWSTVRPAGWPLAIALPTDGELLLAGVDDVTAEELGGRGLQWYDPAAAASPGGIYLVSAECRSLPDSVLDATGDLDRAALAEHYGIRLTGDLHAEIMDSAQQRAGGRIWQTWRVRQPHDGIREAQNEFVLAVTVVKQQAVEMWCHYAKPWDSKDSAATLARILSGGRKS
jgi:hypothetical protein